MRSIVIPQLIGLRSSFRGAPVIHCCCLALISFQQRHLCPILAMAEVVNAKIGCKCLLDGPLGSSHQH